MEIAAQPRVKSHQINSQSFHKTTKQERMQKYYKHIQAKYSNQTSLKPPRGPQRKATSSMNLTPRTPTQRIGNFSYPSKACQNPESSLGRTSAIMMYSNVSEEHNCHPTFLPEASVGPKYHGNFSGNSLPKWNQLYRAYRASSN